MCYMCYMSQNHLLWIVLASFSVLHVCYMYVTCCIHVCPNFLYACYPCNESGIFFIQFVYIQRKLHPIYHIMWWVNPLMNVISIIWNNISSDQILYAYSAPLESRCHYSAALDHGKFDIMLDLIVDMYKLSEGNMSIFISEMKLVHFCT